MIAWAPAVIAEAFRPLANLPCWNVKRGHGTFLTFDFGEPHLEIAEPRKAAPEASPRAKQLLARRRVILRGEWYLWIYCCMWQVRDGARVVGDWSSSRRIDRAASFLAGQKLISVSIPKRGVRTTFTFDLNGTLETAPYDRSSEQWMLYEPDGRVLTVRAGGEYNHAQGDAQQSMRWRKLVRR